MLRQFTANLGDLLAGDLRGFGGPSAPEPVAGRIRAEQISIVLRNTPVAMLANMVNASVLVLALWASPDRTNALLWAGAMIVVAGFIGLRAITSYQPVKPRSASRRAMQKLVRNAGVFGVWWGTLPVLFFHEATSGAQVVIACLCVGMISGSAAIFAKMPAAAISFTLPIFIGSTFAILGMGDIEYLLVAILIVSYGVILFRSILAHAFEFTEQLILQAESERAIRRDHLTRLPNRFSFNERLESALARVEKFGERFALLIFDLDNFKEINDRFGHTVGDALLVEVAARLRRSTREDDKVARLEGDEFAVVATEGANVDQIIGLAEQIIGAFRDPFSIEGREIHCGACIGVALAPSDGLDSDRLLRCADVALYRAKKLGPGSIQFFSADDDKAAAKRQVLERDLGSAIANGQLSIAFQPFLGLQRNRIEGFEALLRWQHPTYGAIPPSEFVAIAEETGLIHSIGEWAIGQACQAAVHWPDDCRISVNLSVAQFNNRELLKTIRESLSDARLEPGRFEVEITESILISNFDEAIAFLNSLRDIGVTIALDDFGTGYSSLTYLRKLPLARLKIDQSFVRDMLNDSDCASIVRSLVELAHELGISVVAEGVETPKQLTYLKHIKCDEVQGFLIGRPAPLDLIPAMLAEQSHASPGVGFP
jgi:diguanylate cyclase